MKKGLKNGELMCLVKCFSLKVEKISYSHRFKIGNEFLRIIFIGFNIFEKYLYDLGKIEAIEKLFNLKKVELYENKDEMINRVIIYVRDNIQKSIIEDFINDLDIEKVLRRLKIPFLVISDCIIVGVTTIDLRGLTLNYEVLKGLEYYSVSGKKVFFI